MIRGIHKAGPYDTVDIPVSHLHNIGAFSHRNQQYLFELIFGRRIGKRKEDLVDAYNQRNN